MTAKDHCPVCFAELESSHCVQCANNDFIFSFARSAANYDNEAKSLVHGLKYGGYQALAIYFAEKMAERLHEYPEFAEYDTVAAVPLHRVRKRERGFNQSELIGRNFAKMSGKNFIDLVQRKRYTRSQTDLDFRNRKRNVSGAFEARKQTRGKSVILIDDVFTTGHTINECALALFEAGAHSVAAYTFCRAMR